MNWKIKNLCSNDIKFILSVSGDNEGSLGISDDEGSLSYFEKTILFKVQSTNIKFLKRLFDDDEQYQKMIENLVIENAKENTDSASPNKMDESWLRANDLEFTVKTNSKYESFVDRSDIDIQSDFQSVIFFEVRSTNAQFLDFLWKRSRRNRFQKTIENFIFEEAKQFTQDS